MSLQMRSCQTHKRCAIFRLMAINTSHELQHSSNLYFHESPPPPPLFPLRRTALSLTLLLAHAALLGDLA